MFGLKKLLKSKKMSKNVTYVVLGLLAVGLVYGISMYSNGKGLFSEGNTNNGQTGEGATAIVPQAMSQPTTLGVDAPGCAAKAIVDPAELLPKDQNREWAQLNPIRDSDPLQVSHLDAGHHIGMIAQSLRNPNLQLRSEPINPKGDVGPWNNSTIEPDTLRRPLEIGSSA